MHIKIGSRESALSIKQTQLVIEKLELARPHYTFEIVQIRTTGDRIKNVALYDIGGKALFTKEIEDSLIAGEIDIGVHSMKDVPAIYPAELFFPAVIEREDPRDLFIARSCTSLQEMPIGSVIGTCSVRRKAQILAVRPDIRIVTMRGNINTRLDKFQNSQNLDAIILALSGLKRLGIVPQHSCIFEINEMLPAICQGIVGMQCRRDRKDLIKVLQAINHIPTWTAFLAERSFVEFINGSCYTPLAGYARLTNNCIFAKFGAFHPLGEFQEFTELEGSPDQAEMLGKIAGKKLIKFL